MDSMPNIKATLEVTTINIGLDYDYERPVIFPSSYINSLA